MERNEQEHGQNWFLKGFMGIPDRFTKTTSLDMARDYIGFRF